MRKFQHVALVVAAAGGLSAIGVGPSVAAAPVAHGNSAPPPGPAMAGAFTATQATAHASGPSGPSAPRQAAPAQPAEVAPQVNPQINPQLNPHISSPSAPTQSSGAADQFNLFRPAQECSPQSVLNANLPVAVLAAAETKGVACTQANSQANALAKAH
ncbi:hypothetical protein ACIBW9_24895 [Streptomyces sp. NPDC049541]|uniref:hypothetical protein n=1 Tax=Streptomyces sp. NPDC049541 TaxID=3365594 RepID=UPI0037968FEE